MLIVICLSADCGLCSVTRPWLIEIFKPYRAAAHTDEAVKLADFDITRVQSQKTGRNINGRDSVYRIWPVCFFDDLLCRRGFGIGTAEAAARRAGVRARQVLHGGAFLLMTSEVIVGPALDALSARVMARLGNGRA